MADVEERPARQLATNLRELMKQVDIRTGTDRDTNANKERDNESVASASVRDIFARARTNLPTPASRITRPRGLSIDSDVLSTNDGDDASTVESTPIARVPPAAASLHALRQRLETASDASDLTGWDRSARSLLTTRGQASQSRLNVYDDGSNLLDEDLGQVPALTVSHVDFAPSVANTSHTSVGTPRQRPPVIPKGPSLQSASIADRLAGIPDDGLEFDDTDREDFDRNLMGDDSDDLLHRDNDLLRSSSPPPPDSPIKPPVRPISGSWENVMPEGSVMSLPNVDGRKPDRKQELNSSGGSGGSSGSRLMQAIQDEEDSYQRSMHEKSGSTAVGDETQRPSVSPDKTNRPTSRLSISGRSRLPMAKASTSSTSKPTPASSKPAPDKPAPATDRPGHRATRSDVAFPSSQDGPVHPVNRLGAPETSRIPRLSSPGPGARPPNRPDGPQSPASPRTSIVPPVTPSRIPRVSMSSPHSSFDGSPSMGRSVPAVTPSRTRATSALHNNPPVTTPSRTRATSAMGRNGTPPETDVDRERGWAKQLPKLTHANLRMRHDQMDTVQSYLSGMSPEGKSVTGRSRPTTPSFVGYSRKGTSEVSSSQGSAGSDEDTELRRSRKLSLASAKGTKSGRELRGSPSASSVTRSPGLTRTSSLKTPSKTGAPNMRHSLSFTGSPSATGSDRGMSPMNSPRRLSNRSSTEFVSPKEYQVLRERDWGRPAHSRALGLANVRTRGGTPAPGGRKRVVSGGSMAGSDAGLTSPARERTGTAKPRPHTVHLGGSFTGGGGPSLEQLGREPLDGFEDDGMSESVLEWQRRQQSIEDLQEETEVEMEITRPESPSPPSPSRSIPLPDSPPPPTRPLQRGTTPPPRPLSRNHSVPKVQLHPPQEPSVSLFGDRMVGESTTLESSRERRDSLRRDSTIREERETTIREERRESIRDEREFTRVDPLQEEERPDSPKHLTFAQPDSPTISFMDTLPPLPEPPSDDEQSMVVQPVRPSVNTRLSRIVREPSPGSGGSGSEKTPRASTMSLRVPSPGVPTPPEPETAKEAPTTSFLGLEPTPIQSDTLEVPRPIRTRSRSNTLGTTLPRVDVNAFVQRDEIDSAATPIATRWNPPAREENKPVEAKAPRKPSPLASQVSSPAIQSSASLPSSPVPPPLQARHSDSQLPPMMSQKGKEILQRMQQQAATLARDLKAESQQTAPQGDETKAETEQIVQLSVTARAERERLERLRQARGPKEQVKVVEVPVRRRSISWILFSILVSALCVWLALYALSHHATNVYLDPLYPVLYGGDNNPLRSARSIDTFPTAWHMYLVPKGGIEHWLTPITQKLWALPTNWRPS